MPHLWVRYRRVMPRIAAAFVIAVALAACGGGEDLRIGTWIAFRTAPRGVDDGAIVVTDGEERLTFGAGRAYGSLAWSPDGRRIAGGTAQWTGEDDPNADFVLVDLDAGSFEVVDLPEGSATNPLGVAWSPNGRMVAVASGETAWLFNRDGELVAEHAVERRAGYRGNSVEIEWTEDSSRVAVGVGSYAYVLDAESASLVDPLARNGRPPGEVAVFGWADGDTLVLVNLTGVNEGEPWEPVFNCTVGAPDEPCDEHAARDFDYWSVWTSLSWNILADEAFPQADARFRTFPVAGDRESAAAVDLETGEILVATPSGMVTIVGTDLAPDFLETEAGNNWIAFYHREP